MSLVVLGKFSISQMTKPKRISGEAGLDVRKVDCRARHYEKSFELRNIYFVNDTEVEIPDSRDTLEREIVGLLHQISHHGRQMFIVALERDKLNLTHWMILEDLSAHSAGLAMSDIADHLGLPPSSVTGLVDALEQRGWTQRLKSSDDRRVVHVALTKTGSKQVLRITEHLMQQYRESMQDMSEAQLFEIRGMYATMLSRMLEYRRSKEHATD